MDASFDSDQSLSLSLSQREVWLDQRAWPESPHLNIGGYNFMRGPLDEARFRAALACLVAENEALRLVPLPDGSQRVLEHVEPQLLVIDVGPGPNPHEAIRDHCQALIAQPFALDGRPLWRMVLLRAGPALHGLTIQFHHLVMDGWGTSLVMQRWCELYNEIEREGAARPLVAPRYRQFVIESNAYRDSDAFLRDEAYWRAQVPVLPAPLVERRYAEARTEHLPGSRVAVQAIARADYARLEAHAQEQRASTFNYFLAALALYFARVNHCTEVLIGVPSLNRGGRHFKSTLGMFAGVLAVRVDVGQAMRVDQLLAGVRTAMRGALRHPRYPLSELVRHLEVMRSGRDGLLDVLLSFEKQDYKLKFGGAESFDSRQLLSGTARYPLGVTVCDFGPDQDAELILDASTACFAEGEADLLARRLWLLVEALRTMPEARIDELPILPPDEAWALLHGLHKDIACHEAPQPFIALFEHQAALRPEAIALVWDGGSCDYAGLDRRAGELAARLRELGAGRDTVLAVAIERSPAMVLALLAIAKAGAAFLPLDPDAPRERLAEILEQSRAVALLIAPDAFARLGQLHAVTVGVHWAEQAPAAPAAPAASAASEDAPPPRAAAGDLAYVLFTSGSTGRPKGVMVEHGTLARRLAWLSRAYAADWRDCACQATQITFDPSLIETLLPLIHGGRIALPPPGRLLPESLADFAVRHGVTIMAFVPSTLSRFLDGITAPSQLKLRVACCGGEVLAPALARRFLAHTGAHLYNVYGPTEASIFATAWKCSLQDGESPLPLGRPIDDTRIYVLDRQLRPMPLGIAGDIYIGGATLARGYLHRPELDAQCFLPDPFQAGGRMYRTGDRGWLGIEGNLHFIGRSDRQVKLRGYRIELGEIESTCLLAPGVTQAAAMLVDAGGKPQIHAWVGAAAGVTAQHVKDVLRQRLPDYMVPAAIGVQAELQQGSAGKIDYAALPALGAQAPAAFTRAPGSALERALLPLWEAVLDARPIGVQDNFFDIGGDSLAAVALLASIETMLGRKVSMYTLTEYPTIERLAVALGKKITPPGLMVRVGPDNGRVPLYLAASGHGDLLRFQDLGRALADSYEVFMLQPPTDQPIRTMGELAELYASCVAAQGREPGVVAGFSVGGVAALETARQLQDRGMAQRALVLIDTINPRAPIGGTASWRMLGWLVRNLRVQELSLNGRRLGALFNDPGLVGQVMALRGYRAIAYHGRTVLIRSSGLANWDRLFFGAWRRVMANHLIQRSVRGLHGSMFEAANVGELAKALAEVMREADAER